jgi:hypothetical protein
MASKDFLEWVKHVEHGENGLLKHISYEKGYLKFYLAQIRDCDNQDLVNMQLGRCWADAYNDEFWDTEQERFEWAYDMFENWLLATFGIWYQ